MCVKGSLVLVLVLYWTPQGVDAQPAMRRGRTAGLPKKNWVAGPPERRDRWIQFAIPRLWHTNHVQVVSVWCLISSSSISSLFHLSNTCI